MFDSYITALDARFGFFILANYLQRPWELISLLSGAVAVGNLISLNKSIRSANNEGELLEILTWYMKMISLKMGEKEMIFFERCVRSSTDPNIEVILLRMEKRRKNFGRRNKK